MGEGDPFHRLIYPYSSLFLLGFSCFIMPRCLWVWSTLEAKLQALIIQIDPILCAQWRPSVEEKEGEEGDGEERNGYNSKTPVLAFCTGTARIYFWTPKEGSIEGDIRWSDAVPSSGSSVSSVSFNMSISSNTTSGIMNTTAGAQKPISKSRCTV